MAQFARIVGRVNGFQDPLEDRPEEFSEIISEKGGDIILAWEEPKTNDQWEWKEYPVEFTARTTWNDILDIMFSLDKKDIGIANIIENYTDEDHYGYRSDPEDHSLRLDETDTEVEDMLSEYSEDEVNDDW